MAHVAKSSAALRVEEEVVRTLKDILANDGHPDAEIVTGTVRVMNKDVIEVVWVENGACATSEICCLARRVLVTHEGMPA